MLRTSLVLAAAPFALTACTEVPLTGVEVMQALDEAVAASKAAAFTGEVVEIATDFTIGQGVQDAAAELGAFLRSQADCSTVTVVDHTVTVDFGELDDACEYRGHTFAGVAMITIDRAEHDGVQVHHEWLGLTNGEVTLDGEATVTWDLSAGTRHVVHEAVWQIDDRTIVGAGDRMQSLLSPELGITGGIVIDGERSWTSDRGTWELDIDGVEVRWQDAVPQAGAYTLVLPNGKIATLTFERLDETTIEVVLTGGRVERVWHVSPLGMTEA